VRPVRICAGIICWQDGPALTNAVRSVRGHVDEIVIVDGIIAGVDPHGLPPYDDPGEAVERTDMNEMRRDFGARIHVCAYQTQAVKHTKLLRYCSCDYYDCDWLLVIDADEQLRNGEQLRGLVDTPIAELVSFIMVTVDDGSRRAARLLRVREWDRYLVGAHTLESVRGNTVALPSYTHTLDEDEPWIEHRPELRPEGRREIRLGELQCALEGR
jgi:hypothetical protein